MSPRAAEDTLKPNEEGLVETSVAHVDTTIANSTAVNPATNPPRATTDMEAFVSVEVDEESQCDDDDDLDDGYDDESDACYINDDSSGCDDDPCPPCARRVRTVDIVEKWMERKDQNCVDIKLAPLQDKSNWAEWLIGMELIFRMHQVWPLVSGQRITPLKPGHHFYEVFKRMELFTIALIYANVGENVRRHGCFQAAVRMNRPNLVMANLDNHYGEDAEEHAH